MLDFFTANLGTIVVGAVVLLIILFAAFRIRKDKKEGKSCSCGCSCSGCPSAGMCHGNVTDKS